MNPATTLTRSELQTFLRLGAYSVSTAALFLAISYPLAAKYGGVAWVDALPWGLACALLGSLVAAIAPARAVRSPAQTLAAAVLANLVIRFIVALTLALLLRAAAPVDGDALLIWVGLAQTALLVVDSVVLCGWTREVTGATC